MMTSTPLPTPKNCAIFEVVAGSRIPTRAAIQTIIQKKAAGVERIFSRILRTTRDKANNMKINSTI